MTGLRQGGNLPETDFEFIEHCADLGRKSREQWDNRLVLGRTDLIEHYRNGRLTIRLDFSLLGLEPRQHTAVFHGRPFGHIAESSGLHFDWRRKIELFDPGLKRGPRDDKQAVLIGVVQVMKHPEGVGLRGSASVKRLVRTDQILCGGRNSLYYSLSSGFESIACDEDREAAFVGGGIPSLFDKLPNQEIESGPLLLQDLPNKNADFWRERFAVGEDNGKPLKFGVVLGPNSLAVFLTEGLDGGLEIIDTFIGPFDLQSRAN
jgi:hypothetical protein